MTRTSLILIATLGSALLLAGAWTFQLLGYPPCKLCHWQRWPHYAAVAIGALALLSRLRFLPWFGALAAAATAAVGIYHTGVEQKWWLGPTTCTSGSVAGISADDLLAQINNAPLIRCDEVAWALVGVSMASWNAIFSALLVLLWIVAARRA
jgi:disulfide bond formation protein DsbB